MAQRTDGYGKVIRDARMVPCPSSTCRNASTSHRFVSVVEGDPGRSTFRCEDCDGLQNLDTWITTPPSESEFFLR